ncbi:MAG TPA: hypothetical protein DCP08_02810 [Chloroflexi bacterium]|nr:hypothetical protein [Chloroflexota bacterium]
MPKELFIDSIAWIALADEELIEHPSDFKRSHSHMPSLRRSPDSVRVWTAPRAPQTPRRDHSIGGSEAEAID